MCYNNKINFQKGEMSAENGNNFQIIEMFYGETHGKHPTILFQVIDGNIAYLKRKLLSNSTCKLDPGTSLGTDGLIYFRSPAVFH